MASTIMLTGTYMDECKIVCVWKVEREKCLMLVIKYHKLDRKIAIVMYDVYVCTHALAVCIYI